jgi:hypothetical protein
MSHIRTFRTLAGDVCCSGQHFCDNCRALRGRYEDLGPMASAPAWTAALSTTLPSPAGLVAAVQSQPSTRGQRITAFFDRPRPVATEAPTLRATALAEVSPPPDLVALIKERNAR